MKNRTRTQALRPPYVLLLAAISAAQILFSIPWVTVSNAQTESESPVPGAGGDPGGPAAPVLKTRKGPGWINVYWEPVAGAVEYDVWWRIGADGAWQRTYQSPITQTAYGFLGYSAGTTLYFTVRAIDSDGRVSPWSQQAQDTALARLTSTPTVTAAFTSTPTSTTTPTETVSAPVLTAASTGTGAVDLSWTAVTGAVRYELWAWDSASDWQQLDDGNLTGRSHRHENVTPGTTYYYTVRAVAADGTASPWSDQKAVTVPGSPQSLAAPTLTAQSTMAAAVELSWNSVSGAVRYELWAWDSAGGWQQLDDGNLTGTSHTHTQLAPGTIYYYSIRAVDASGATSAWSQYAEATVSSPQSPILTTTTTPTTTPTTTSTTTPTVAVTPTVTATPTATSPAPDPAAERAALVALYQATGGANWTNNDNWLSTEPLSTWEGVSTDPNGHVTRLYLPNNELRGQLPDLSALTNLTGLALSNNDLTGPIPDLSALTNLTSLYLYRNELTGSVPDLSTLTKLMVLHLSYNELTGPFPDLGALTNLDSLHLDFNQLSGPVPDLSSLTKLERLSLSYNELSGPVPDLSALTKLERLYLDHNQFSGQFPDLSALTNLKTLSLGSNQFPGPFPDLSALTELENLSLTNNQLTGPIPDLSALTNLTRLYLFRNQLSGPIPDLRTLTELTVLHLSNNRLSGQIPDLSLLTNLTEIYLSDNELTGPVPDLRALSQLTHLNLRGNELCLPAGLSLSHSNSRVADHLQSLTLPSCTATDTHTATPTPTTTYTHTATPTPSTTSTPTPGPPPTASPTATITPTREGSALTAPQLRAEATLTNAIELSWAPVPGAVRYNLWTWWDATLSWQRLDEGDLTGTSYTHVDLTPGTTYHYAIRAVDASGTTSPWSQYPSATVPASVVVGPTATPTATTTPTATPETTHTPTATVTATTPPPAPAAERAALVALYNDTGGPNWTRNDNWLTDEPISTWYGVTTNPNGSVTDLHLPANGLSGSIPDLSRLSRLAILDLNSNQLTGAIPGLSALTNLTSLSLNDNRLAGSIPALSALTNLTTLDLSNNLLVGQIPDLSTLTVLASLNLSNNQLDGPLPNLSALTSLAWLSISANQLCLPASADLSVLHSDVSAHLRSLNLPSCTVVEHRTALVALYEATGGANWTQNTNWLTDQPLASWFGVTTNESGLVTELQLSGNQLSGDVSELGALTTLTSLELDSNQLTGSFPDLSVLTNLTTLDLSNNRFDGEIPALSAFVSLEILDLGANQLSGPIPSLSNLSNLTTLNLSDNRLTGGIPALSALTNLTSLDLSENQLDDPIPDLAALTSLTGLDLSDNHLEGQIPSLITLASLTSLDLGNNHLSGEIPALSSLTGLTTLDLSGNNLCLPEGADLSVLHTEVAAHITGLTLPSCAVLADRTALVALYADADGANWTDNTNWLTDQPLSTWYGITTDDGGRVTELDLSGNGLIGTLPVLNALTKLTSLDLNTNQLSGSIPALNAFTNLTNLDLSANLFSGDIPDLGALFSLTDLVLRFNTLSGEIPDLSALTMLTTLALNHNQLDGPVPDLSALADLAAVDMSGNSLCLPDSYDLTSLNTIAADHIRSLNLSACSDTEAIAKAREKAALVALYNATGGSNWKNNDNWLTGEPLDAWHGITTDSNGRVTRLSLDENDLKGNIPDLSALTELRVLDLSFNSLSGPIPDLSAFTNLEELDLTENMLNGPLPDLSALTKLRGLYVAINLLSGPVPDLSALTELIGLDLASNHFTGPVPDLSALSKLIFVELKFNRFCKPDSVTLSHPHSDVDAHLKALNLASCSAILQEQKDTLVALYNATDGPNWTRRDNWLSGEPVDKWTGVTTGDHSYVTSLDLAGNNLSGTVPSLNALTGLTSLDLSDNDLSGAIPSISALTLLSNLDFSDNDLGGTIPSLAALSSLTSLNFSGNDLSGQIPDLTGLTSLNSLDLSNNQLEGAIPDLASLTSLTSLNISGNRLCLPAGASLSHPNSAVAAHLQSLNPTACKDFETEALAAERAALVALYNATDGPNWTRNDNWLSNEPVGTWHGIFTNELGRVRALALGSNGLRGSLPDLSALTNLTGIRLNYNHLSGPIPDLSALVNLRTVYIPGNDLNGQIPDLSNLTNLSSLHLWHNDLSGPVPDLKSLSNLRVLALGYNRLSGQIPNLDANTALDTLSIAGNQFTGSIPDLSKLTRLRKLNLNSNQLSGQISGLSQLTNLKELYLADNQFSGQIPDLSKLVNLNILSLANNQFTGQIPDLSKLTSLTSLNLSNNQLTGQIPALDALVNLTSLDLNNNQLTGQIPALAALTKLKTLYLSNNRLNGKMPEVSGLTLLASIRLNDNQLTGQIPDLSTLAELRWLRLDNNQLSGPILDLNQLARLSTLTLSFNQLTGPFPDLSGLTSLSRLNLRGNQLCRPAGADLAGSNSAVTAHLNSLNLADCTDAELAAVPGTPQNLTATVAADKVALTWDAVENAVSYNLRAWNGFDLSWSDVSGVLTDTTTFTHTVLTDGRNYYYQVRARDANDVRGAWSEQLYVSVVPTEFPPPPLSLGLDRYYQKHMVVEGVTVVAPNWVSDQQMIRSRAVITGLLANRSDVFVTLAGHNTRVYIQDHFKGIAQKWVAYTPVTDPYCDTFIHEFVHLIDFALEEQTDAETFDTRLRALYQAAVNAGLWRGYYANTNAEEYWAETVKYWVWESHLIDRDPEIVKLIEETLGEVTIPAACKP